MNPKKKNKDNNKKRYDELCWISTRDVYEKMEPMDLDQPISCNKIHPKNYIKKYYI